MAYDYEYDAYGNSYDIGGTTANNYLYRGEQWDPDLGLYYLRARYYNPLTGRLVSRDPDDGNPRDPLSLHKYLYADGDPVNGMDPTGHMDTAEVGQIDLRVVVLNAAALPRSCNITSAAPKGSYEFATTSVHPAELAAWV